MKHILLCTSYYISCPDVKINLYSLIQTESWRAGKWRTGSGAVRHFGKSDLQGDLLHQLPGAYRGNQRGRLQADPVDHCQFVSSKSRVPRRLDIVQYLLRTGRACQDTGDDTVVKDPAQCHLGQGLTTLGSQSLSCRICSRRSGVRVDSFRKRGSVGMRLSAAGQQLLPLPHSP